MQDKKGIVGCNRLVEHLQPLAAQYLIILKTPSLRAFFYTAGAVVSWLLPYWQFRTVSPSPDVDLRRRDAGEQMRAGLAGSGLKELGTDGVMASCLAVVEFLQLSFHRYTGWPSQAGGAHFLFSFLLWYSNSFSAVSAHIAPIPWLNLASADENDANCFICNTGTFHKEKKQT